MVVMSLVTLASVHVVVAAATGRQATVGEALRSARTRVLQLAGWSFVAGLAVLVGICACLLPGIYLSLVFLLLPPVVAFDRIAPIPRSFRLFHADVGGALARTATIGGLAFAAAALGGVVSIVITLLVLAVSTGTGAVLTATLLGGLFAPLALAAVGVLTAPLTVLAYADLRARIEPVSTPQLAAELGL
jgi:hypothetical protein